MNKFKSVNSYIYKLTPDQLQKFFEELVKTHPNGFTINQLKGLPSFVALPIKPWDRGDFGTVLAQRFRLMKLTTYEDGKWNFLACVNIPVIIPTVERTVELMRELEEILIEMGYSKVESAVYEKTEVVSITI